MFTFIKRPAFWKFFHGLVFFPSVAVTVIFKEVTRYCKWLWKVIFQKVKIWSQLWRYLKISKSIYVLLSMFLWDFLKTSELIDEIRFWIVIIHLWKTLTFPIVSFLAFLASKKSVWAHVCIVIQLCIWRSSVTILLELRTEYSRKCYQQVSI